MNADPKDVAVVGGGIIGAWAALHLAEQRVPTTLFEQFPLPHTRGSSHGLSRAFRLLGDDTLDRLDYSLERWRALEGECGHTLFVPTGLLNLGPEGDEYLEKYTAVLHSGGRPFRWLSRSEVAAEYAMLRFEEDWGAIWDPSGGLLLAHRCLQAVQERFKALGGHIATAHVRSVEAGSDSGAALELHSPLAGTTEVRSFERLIVSAGPWTGKLIPEVGAFLESLLTPVTYWRDRTGKFSAAAGFPILFNARLTGVYALPSLEYPDLVKVLYHSGPATDPDSRDRADTTPWVEKVGRYVGEHMPGLDSAGPAIEETCMYTMTPDSQPIIDRLENGVVLGCGFSGSGFKHAPATGKMLASLALGREAELPEGFELTRYGAGRFARPHGTDSGT
jgi:sarcosine oxidase/L-pipecolate oxidase